VWRTPNGERTLIGAEAALIRDLVGYLYDQIDIFYGDPEDSYKIGISGFDRLQASQQLALLYEVAAGLLEAQEPVPKLTALREATVAVLFEELRVGVEMEISGEIADDGFQFEPYVSWRERILAVYLEDGGSAANLPDVTCPDRDEWDCLIDALADRILWDADWDMEALFLDDSPENSSYLKEVMMISEDYYQDVAPARPERIWS
jgi:hypothetical protein